MQPYQIVLDTNVLLAALRSNRGASYKLLTLLNDSRWQLNISTALIFEYEEVLKRERKQFGLNLEDINAIISSICTIANQRSIFYLWRPIAHINSGCIGIINNLAFWLENIDTGGRKHCAPTIMNIIPM
ncbi:MAG: putative toxin-antitoxin system toxin component, PIN family [Symploca sp. SIO2E6]|nr:putative toxin-antitoxin system toxin component, PIN family [Symploca sp. SIO2E6]